LLTHTSGIGYGLIDADERFKMIYQKAGVTDLFTTEPVTIKESVQKLAALPLHHQPGEKYTYSEGLDVLGYFIEVVSGMPFDVFLRKRLFEPLGMNDTWFYLPEEKAARLVTVQKPENGKWIAYPTTFYDPQYPVKGAKTFFSGGAGLSSTARDYAAFLQMYLNRRRAERRPHLKPHYGSIHYGEPNRLALGRGQQILWFGLWRAHGKRPAVRRPGQHRHVRLGRLL
jgi:CubicO group peptidase (beta-lactamase class C family)